MRYIDFGSFECFEFGCFFNEIYFKWLIAEFVTTRCSVFSDNNGDRIFFVLPSNDVIETSLYLVLDVIVRALEPISHDRAKHFDVGARLRPVSR